MDKGKDIADELLAWIKERNPRVAKFLSESYSRKNGKDVALDPGLLEETVSFLAAHSVIAAAVLASPGSSIISELIYEQIGDSPVDMYFFKSRSGAAVKGRQEAMQNYLVAVMSKCIKERGKVAVGDLGSGPGRYIINAVLRLFEKGHPRGAVRASCFDIDENAVLRGNRLAVIYGVDDAVRFRRVDMQRELPKFQKGKFDILLLKGILCPYDPQGCRTLMEHVKPMLRSGGTVVASNVSKKMAEDDPFTCFIMNRIGNWVMCYKDEAELKGVFEGAGFIWKGSFADPLGYHIMGVGETPPC